jgi:hypothetical protein
MLFRHGHREFNCSATRAQSAFEPFLKRRAESCSPAGLDQSALRFGHFETATCPDGAEGLSRRVSNRPRPLGRLLKRLHPLSEPFRKSCSLSCSSPKPKAKLWLLIGREPQWMEVNQSFNFIFATPKKGFEHEHDNEHDFRKRRIRC